MKISWTFYSKVFLFAKSLRPSPYIPPNFASVLYQGGNDPSSYKTQLLDISKSTCASFSTFHRRLPVSEAQTGREPPNKTKTEIREFHLLQRTARSSSFLHSPQNQPQPSRHDQQGTAREGLQGLFVATAAHAPINTPLSSPKIDKINNLPPG